jgi:hypothetical protein
LMDNVQLTAGDDQRRDSMATLLPVVFQAIGRSSFGQHGLDSYL